MTGQQRPTVLAFDYGLRRIGVAVGTGTHLVSGGLSYLRGDGFSGWYFDAHAVLVRPGLVGGVLAPGVGFGASVGWDFRAIPWLSVKTGVGLAYRTGLERGFNPVFFELNAGPVF